MAAHTKAALQCISGDSSELPPSSTNSIWAVCGPLPVPFHQRKPTTFKCMISHRTLRSPMQRSGDSSAP